MLLCTAHMWRLKAVKFVLGAENSVAKPADESMPLMLFLAKLQMLQDVKLLQFLEVSTSPFLNILDEQSRTHCSYANHYQ